jgi:putative transposase
MRKSKFTEQQIAFALRQAETGTKVKEIIRKLGITEHTLYRWKRQYGGLGPSELRRLRLLETENKKLKQMVADLSLDKAMLQEVIEKALKAVQKRPLALFLQESFQIGERRASRVLSLSRSTCRYRSTRKDPVVLPQRIRDLAEARVRYGCRRIHILLRREGFKVSKHRVPRLYREKGLSLRRKRPRRHVSAARRTERPKPQKRNESWSMDFVSDSLFDGRRFRAFTLVENFSRECLAIQAAPKLHGFDVAEVLDQVVARHGKPTRRADTARGCWSWRLDASEQPESQKLTFGLVRIIGAGHKHDS